MWRELIYCWQIHQLALHYGGVQQHGGEEHLLNCGGFMFVGESVVDKTLKLKKLMRKKQRQRIYLTKRGFSHPLVPNHCYVNAVNGYRFIRSGSWLKTWCAGIISQVLNKWII